MELWQTIEELINIVEIDPSPQNKVESRLSYLLDRMALEMHRISLEEVEAIIEGDGSNKGPTHDINTTHKAAAARFSNWGYYNIPLEITHKISETKLAVGDAIDDIANIIYDLKTTIWFYRNGLEAHALWHLKFSYVVHWRQHMRSLQLYLHFLEKESG